MIYALNYIIKFIKLDIESDFFTKTTAWPYSLKQGIYLHTVLSMEDQKFPFSVAINKIILEAEGAFIYCYHVGAENGNFWSYIDGAICKDLVIDYMAT